MREIAGRNPMPAASGVDAPNDIRLSSNYFRCAGREWLPQSIDDPSFPSTVYAAGREYVWGLREFCIMRTLFESGAHQRGHQPYGRGLGRQWFLNRPEREAGVRTSAGHFMAWRTSTGDISTMQCGRLAWDKHHLSCMTSRRFSVKIGACRRCRCFSPNEGRP
jgi:hypothetical protein